MAIQITTKNPKNILKAFGVKQDLIDLVSMHGISIEVKTSSVTLKKGAGNAHIAIKAGAISMALAGKLGPASKQSIGYKLEKAIKTLDTNEFIHEGTMTGSFMSNKESADNISKLKEPIVVGMDLAEIEQKVMSQELMNELYEDPHDKGIEVYEDTSEGSTGVLVGNSPTPNSLLEVLCKTPVPLLQATHLYQPVKGTGTNSVYHVIGISKDLKIAARLKGNTVSVRVEGAVQTYKDDLDAVGFGMGNLSSGYVSMHLSVPDNGVARKSIGAVLAGLAQDMMTVMPNIKILEGKGK